MALSPARGWIPVNLPASASSLSLRKTGQKIGEIEKLVETVDSGGIAYMDVPAGVVRLNFPFDDAPMRLEIGAAGLIGLLDAVRNIVLDWSLKLEADGIMGDGMSFSAEEKKLAASHTYHVETMIGTAVNSSVQRDTNVSGTAGVVAGAQSTVTSNQQVGADAVDLLSALQRARMDIQ